MTVETTQGTVTVTIDGFEIAVPKGTWIIRAAELLGIAIPRFCDHPLLEPIGACRQCLVEVEGQRKPLASCITACTEGMVVHTQLTSVIADKAQRGVMELLLINHPLDCPMCDKGGECPLQNQAMSNGQGETRFTEEKRTFAKPVPISTQVLLDRERCISCTRCTRTSEEIAGDAFIEFIGRGPSQFIGTAEGKPFNSYFSGNTVQVCPVGALTGAAYRFRSRPFDLISVPGVCEHCAAGCRQRTDVRRGRVMRRLAGEEPAVNEEWNCDKGRWAFTYATQPDRLAAPLVRDEDGLLVPASWPHALAVAAAGLLAARGAPYPAAQSTESEGSLPERAEPRSGEIAAVSWRRRLLVCPPQQLLVVVARTIARTVAADPNNVPETLDLAGEPGHRRRERDVRDQCRGGRVAQQRRQFHAGQAGIERHPHEACRHDGVVGLEIFADIGNEQRDAIALAQPKAGQRISEPCDAGVEITVGPSRVVVDDRDMIAAPLCKLTPFRADVHVTTPQVQRDR